MVGLGAFFLLGGKRLGGGRGCRGLAFSAPRPRGFMNPFSDFFSGRDLP